jgi:mRNA interferase YafQ
MLELAEAKRFSKDVKRLRKRGKDMSKLLKITDALCRGEKLPESCRNHKLSGDWAHYWECHIEPDWLLVYQYDAEKLYLAATGTHSDLFN